MSWLRSFMQALPLRQSRNGPLDLVRPRPFGLNILLCAQSSLCRSERMRGRGSCRPRALFASNRPIRNGPRIAPRDLSLVIADESCLSAAGAEIAFAKAAAVNPLVPTLASADTPG